VSRTGKIASVKGNMVEIEGDETFRTLKKNVFVIGARESIISLPGG
jgi:ribosomal protein S4E